MLNEYSFTKISSNPNKMLKFGNKDIAEFLSVCNGTLHGRDNLERVDTAEAFYELEPDVKARVLPHLKEKLFYAYKCRDYTYKIEPKALYLLKLCYNQFGSCNKIREVVNKYQLATIFSEESIEAGTCLADYVTQLIDPEFQALEPWLPIVRRKNFAEIYIAATDKVAFVDLDIADMLSYKDIDSLTVKKKEIYIGEEPLCKIGGRYGIARSTYDLRGAV